MPLGVLSDERLARLVSEGNERAFAVIYQRFHQPLHRYCYSMVRHEADSQDALQSTFTSALVALQRGQRNAPLRPWLFRIAHNESISVLRRRRTVEEVPESLPSLHSVEDTAEERARLTTLVADLHELPDQQRGALVMRELSGLSHEDMAQALGISVGAAKQTVFDARRALAEFEEGRAMACREIQRLISDGDRRTLRSRRLRGHLRDCPSCTAFSKAIPERREALMALTPMLAPATAAGLLSRILGGTAHHGGGGGGLLVGAAGKTVGVAVSAKTMVTGLALVATAAVGTVGAIDVATHSGFAAGSAQAAPATHRGHGATGSSHGPTAAATPPATRSHASDSAQAASASHHHPARTAAAGRHAHGSPTSGSRAAGSNNTSSGAGNARTGSHANATANPNAHGGNPNAQGGNANAHGGNPNAKGGNPNAKGGNPNAGGTHAGSGSSNPNAHSGNPNAGGTNSNAHGGNPTSHGGNPNAHGGNPNAHGGTPTTVGGAGQSNGNGKAKGHP